MAARTQGDRPTVVVVGGGYGGIGVAKALDETSEVVLVEPRDAFMHNIAALRALVDPSWLPRIFFPYEGLLANGRVVRDRAVLVDPHRVVTAAGEQIDADYVVLATGSSYPFPAKTDLVDTDHAQELVRETHRALASANVGSRIEVLLGSPLRDAPPTEPGELGTFTVTTEAGVEVSADIWFRCYGVVPNSVYLGEALAPARRADGFIEVTPTLQVAGQRTVFAVGDLSTADAKMAGFAGRQAALVADNINALARGETDLAEYRSMGVGIAVPIGPTGGAGQFPGQDTIVGPETIAEVKGRDLMVDRYGEFFGLATAAAR
jgi:NADH dehydrogenase FAD-containing subunit